MHARVRNTPAARPLAGACLGLLVVAFAVTAAAFGPHDPAARAEPPPAGQEQQVERINRELAFEKVTYRDPRLVDDGIGLQPYTALELGRRALVVRDLIAAKQAQDAADAAAAASRRARIANGTSGAPITGTCAENKPPGFPDAIIRRESGGSPTARNPSGAYGCAQIMPEHYAEGGGCFGMDEKDCWAHLWAGGAGASNWACTPESGCG